MTFDQALAWLYSTQQFGIKLGLENTRRLLAAVGDPHKRLRFFHVAGTNGKGSTCAMLDAMVRAGGHRTGLYTSPHLVDFGERIRVNGRMISAQETAARVAELHELTAEWERCPTFFELTTVLALSHFADEKCDVVVLETGMGGRLDATNVVEPMVSVLTPIGMDHAEWLGDTLEKIAGEKAGIIKACAPAVSAPQKPGPAEVFCNAAKEVGTRIDFVDAPWTGPVALPGEHQRWNAALAVASIAAAGIALPLDKINAALASVVWPARFHEISPRVIIDGAHNPHSAAALVAAWREKFGDERAAVVFGALRDKDAGTILAEIDAIAGRYFFVPVDSPRAADPQSFAEQTQVPATVFSTLAAGRAAALASGAPVLITGSLFLAGEALRDEGVRLFD